MTCVGPCAAQRSTTRVAFFNNESVSSIWMSLNAAAAAGSRAPWRGGSRRRALSLDVRPMLFLRVTCGRVLSLLEDRGALATVPPSRAPSAPHSRPQPALPASLLTAGKMPAL